MPRACRRRSSSWPPTSSGDRGVGPGRLAPLGAICQHLATMSLQHNTYFDGGVQSIGFAHEGDRSSVGVMDVGEYHFGTDAPERMTVVHGELVVQLAGAD